MITHSRIRAVIFDLANTIVENKKGFNPRYEAQVLLGLPSKQHLRNLIFTLSADKPGMDSDEFAEVLVKRTKGKPDEQLIEEIKQIFLYNNKCLQLRPDTLHVLHELRSHGIKLARLSNCTPFARLLVRDLELDKHFDSVVLSSDVGYMKPDPRIFMLTMKQLRVFPDETCVVGDKVKTDILGGTLSGCKTILLETRSREFVINSNLPVYAIIKSLSDILALPLFNGLFHEKTIS
jgi:putative hydrolase of the HAD superfamily